MCSGAVAAAPHDATPRALLNTSLAYTNHTLNQTKNQTPTPHQNDHHHHRNEQYAELQGLYTKYGSKGFTVLGFPCNQVCVRVCACAFGACTLVCSMSGSRTQAPPHTHTTRHRRPRSKPLPLCPPPALLYPHTPQFGAQEPGSNGE
jgi:hypothetical protein